MAALSSDPVLLLHGQPGAACDWDRVQAAVDGRADTIAIDRPGWDGRTRALGLEGNADAALAAIDASGARSVTVVGHSLGAAVAAWLASAQPERVRGLVLLSPAANVASLNRIDYVLAAPSTGYAATVAALGGMALALTARPFRRWVSDRMALDDRYLRAAGRRLLAPTAWRAFVSEQRTLVRELPWLERRLGQISTPTTIVAGRADRIVPISAARRLATQIPGAELVEIDRAGHLLHRQHPDRVADIIAWRAT